jgi:hypothetical protein
MIPIGFKQEHKDAFVEYCNKINPNNDDRLLESKWEMLVKSNVLQIVIDIRTGVTVCSMTSAQMGTSWQLSKDVINSITNIKNYKPLSEEEMARDEMHYNEYNSGDIETDGGFRLDYDVDDILDKISASGYPSLSEGEKEYLASLKK